VSQSTLPAAVCSGESARSSGALSRSLGATRQCPGTLAQCPGKSSQCTGKSSHCPGILAQCTVIEVHYLSLLAQYRAPRLFSSCHLVRPFCVCRDESERCHKAPESWRYLSVFCRGTLFGCAKSLVCRVMSLVGCANFAASATIKAGVCRWLRVVRQSKRRQGRRRRAGASRNRYIATMYR
jgi:hypothetical protein